MKKQEGAREQIWRFVPCFPEIRFSKGIDVDVRDLVSIETFSNLKTKTFYFKGE